MFGSRCSSNMSILRLSLVTDEHVWIFFRQYPMGSVTLFALNVNLHDRVSLKLTGKLKGKDVDEYLLTPENSDLLTK